MPVDKLGTVVGIDPRQIERELRVDSPAGVAPPGGSHPFCIKDPLDDKGPDSI
jgi:hypothetical protein